MSQPRRRGAAANSGEAERGAEALPSASSWQGGCGGTVGVLWGGCGDGGAMRPAGDWQRRWRRLLVLRLLRRVKKEAEG